MYMYSMDKGENGPQSYSEDFGGQNRWESSVNGTLFLRSLITCKSSLDVALYFVTRLGS